MKDFKFIIFGWLMLNIIGCKSDNNVQVFVENSSFDAPSVNLKILLDDKVVIEDIFSVDSLQPSFKIYNFKLNKGIHTIRVESPDQKLVKEDVFNLENDNYIFVSFNYKRKGLGALEQEHKLHQITNPTKEFVPDSILINKEITIHITNEKPHLQ